MRLKSRPVVLKKPVCCRFCKTMIRDGYKLTGPVTDYICDRCYQQIYKGIIEAGAFRLSDLATPEFWSPLMIGEDETALAGLTADMIRRAGKNLSIALLVSLLILMIPALTEARPLSQIGHILSRLKTLEPSMLILVRQMGLRFGHLLQRLSEIHLL